jgi:hypothetical protein
MIGIVICVMPFLLQLYERLGASNNICREGEVPDSRARVLRIAVLKRPIDMRHALSGRFGPIPTSTSAAFFAIA